MTMKKKEIEELKNSIGNIVKLGNKFGVNLLHNFAYREVLVSAEIDSFFEDYKQDKRIHKEDATSKTHQKIEIKTGKSSLGKRKSGFSTSVNFEFDKQNDEIRRRESLLYDALIFSVFDPKTETPVVTAIAKYKQSVSAINKMIESKQENFLLTLQECKKANKRIPRDSISFKLPEIFDVPGIIWVKNEKEISEKKAKKLFYWGKA
jgi:hypothetical protein